MITMPYDSVRSEVLNPNRSTFSAHSSHLGYLKQVTKIIFSMSVHGNLTMWFVKRVKIISPYVHTDNGEETPCTIHAAND